MSLPNPGAIALHAVQAAASFIGVHEVHNSNSGPEVNRFLTGVGLEPGNPWCAAAVHYWLMLAAKAENSALPADFPKSGYVPDYSNWGARKSLLVHPSGLDGTGIAKRGDLVVFYFASMGRCAHIGIVAQAQSNGIWTCEGNTSDSDGVNRDGGQVAHKFRSWGSLGTYGGIIRLPF